MQQSRQRVQIQFGVLQIIRQNPLVVYELIADMTQLALSIATQPNQLLTKKLVNVNIIIFEA
jgi:hypothetical protein